MLMLFKQLGSSYMKSNKVYINKLISTFNFKTLNETYFVIKFKTNKKRISNSFVVIDSITKAKAISIVYEGTNVFYALFLNHNNPLDVKKHMIDNAFDDITYVKEDLKHLPSHILLQLLFNSLSTIKHNHYSNVTGRLFVVIPSMNKYFYKSIEFRQIVTLELKMKQDNIFNLNVVTFTSTKEKDKLGIKEDEFHKYPRYSFSKYNKLARQIEGDDETFIIKQYPNWKNNVPFIDFTNYDKFTASKCGVLYELIERFNDQFNEFASVTIGSSNEFKQFSDISPINEKIDLLLKKHQDFPIAIINYIDDEETEKQLKSFLKNMHFKNVKSHKLISKHKHNIVLIHEQEYYEKNEIEDPYNERNRASIQHITKLDLLEKDYVINNILKELIIKRDLLNKKISLVDMEKLNMNIVAIKYIKNNDYFILEVNEQGVMDYKIETYSLFDESLYHNMIEMLNDIDDNDAILIVINGSIIAIQNTNEFPLPAIMTIGKRLKKESYNEKIDNAKVIDIFKTLDMEEIKGLDELINELNEETKELDKKALITKVSKLSRGDQKKVYKRLEEETGFIFRNYFRSKRAKNKLLPSNLHLHTKTIDEFTYHYYVGAKSTNIKTLFNKASVIRKVTVLHDNGFDMSLFLSLLDVDFVNIDEYSVYPFIIKYLNELTKKHE